MFPLCFIHGVHGVRHDQDADRPVPGAIALVAFRGRFVLAVLSVAVVALMAIAGRAGPDPDVQATDPATSIAERDDTAWQEPDLSLFEEFP